MIRASYKKAIEWIALNDDVEVYDINDIQGQISVLLISDLFDVKAEKIAKDIIKYRKKNNI